MGTIQIGLCSWADKSLIDAGTFYSRKSLSGADRLFEYAREFDTVELNSSYYRTPSPEQARHWAEWTPQDFTWHVKAYRLLTLHPTPPEAFDADLTADLPPLTGRARNHYYAGVPAQIREEVWLRFGHMLAPFRESGKLGMVLFQFPAYVFPETRVFDHILEAQARLQGCALAIEFRNNVWVSEGNRDRTLSFLRDHGLSYVSVDEPQGFRSSVPPLAGVTTTIAYVRFHGRNTATWEKSGDAASDRFNHVYSPEELAEWVPRIEELNRHAERTFLMINTNQSDQAIVNARALGAALRQYHLL